MKDIDKQINAIKHIKEWRWISDMHKYSDEKARAKDVFVLLLALSRCRPYLLCSICGTVSGLMIYLILWQMFDPLAGLLGACVWLLSSWRKQEELILAHIGTGIMFFLFSLYFALNGLIVLSALCGALSFFSSPSSVKMFPWIAIVVWSKIGLFLGWSCLFALPFLLPNLPRNLWRYKQYLFSAKATGHFRCVEGFKPGFREGLPWLVKFYWLFTPILFASSILSGWRIVIAFIPTIFAELTKSVQLSRLYLPQFLGFLWCLGWLATVNPGLAVILAIWEIAYSLHCYYSDVLPNYQLEAWCDKVNNETLKSDFWVHEDEVSSYFYFNGRPKIKYDDEWYDGLE